IQAKPTFTIENNTMQYARYERVEKPSSPSELSENKRFVVKAVNAEFDPLMFNQSTEIKPTFSTHNNTTFYIHPIDANTAYIYLSGRVDTAYSNAQAGFNIPKIVVKDASAAFNIETVSNNSALINTIAFKPYFDVNETITVSSSDIDIAIGALSSYIHTSSFSAHNSSAIHINQEIKFYKVQKAVVPYMLGGNEPTSTAVIPYDYEIADVELTGGVYITVLAWAVRNGYTFYTKANSAPEALELFGFKFESSGTTNRGSTIDPVVGYPTFFRNAIVFCNAFTEWYNSKYDPDLEPVYRDASGNIIRSYNFSTDITDTAISANGGKNGFRLPSVYEWQYAASISKEPLNATYSSYTGTAVMPSLVYAQSYLDPSGFPAKAVNVDLKDYIIYSENYGSTVVVSGVDIGSQGVGNKTSVTRKPNLLNLYDMSGNVAEWTTTATGTDRYVMGGHVNSNKDNVAIGSVMTVSPLEVTQMQDYPNPVGIRLVRSLR
ncbi:MAG: SUMF1/EgtB/PvdO family nonheme iron enzyme, partial [Spirochaetales bacterium]|nr:SUMF1/EgtB/PvdO family nonheme iron enzyme [Spirochaetales bacterium]